MFDFLIIAAAIIVVTVLASYYYHRKGIPPKAQLISDVWKAVESNEEQVNTDSARIHVMHRSFSR